MYVAQERRAVITFRGSVASRLIVCSSYILYIYSNSLTMVSTGFAVWDGVWLGERLVVGEGGVYP